MNRFTAPLLRHSDVIRRVIMICFTGTDGEPIHVNEKCHAVDNMNDESDDSVHLSPCVYALIVRNVVLVLENQPATRKKIGRTRFYE